MFFFNPGNMALSCSKERQQSWHMNPTGKTHQSGLCISPECACAVWLSLYLSTSHTVSALPVLSLIRGWEMGQLLISQQKLSKYPSFWPSSQETKQIILPARLLSNLWSWVQNHWTLPYGSWRVIMSFRHKVTQRAFSQFDLYFPFI